MSAKLAVLDAVCFFRRRGGDRTVVVSGYTSTLDVVAAACAAAGVEKLSRLDGRYPRAATRTGAELQRGTRRRGVLAQL